MHFAAALNHPSTLSALPASGMKSPQDPGRNGWPQQWNSADWRERHLQRLGMATAWPLTLPIGQP